MFSLFEDSAVVGVIVGNVLWKVFRDDVSGETRSRCILFECLLGFLKSGFTKDIVGRKHTESLCSIQWRLSTMICHRD